MKGFKFVLLVFVIYCTNACAVKSMTINDQHLIITPVDSPADIDSRMRADGILLLEDIEAETASAEKSGADTALTEKAVLVALDITFFGMQYFDNIAGIVTKPTIPGSNAIMGFFTFWDAINLFAELKKASERKNMIFTKITFNRPIEYERMRRKGGADNIIRVKLSKNNFVGDKKRKKCGELLKIIPLPDKDKTTKTYAYPYDALWNHSITGKEFLIGFQYDPLAKELPENDICSLKNAERYFLEVVSYIVK